MTAKAQVKTQAKTSAAPAAAHIPQPTAAMPEHEAERPDIAARLEGAARLGHSFGTLGVDRPAPPLIQRQELPEEEEEELQMKREPAAIQRQELPEGEVEELMLKSEEGRVGPQGGRVPPEVEAAIRRARGGGQPLEGALQEQMSARLGHDFSGVRVHTDSEADALNNQLQAEAFTTGPDIFFKSGAYEPGSSRGRELIAHELSHVVQQGRERGSGAGGGMTVRPAGDLFEQAAEGLARAAASQTAGRIGSERDGSGGGERQWEAGAPRVTGLGPEKQRNRRPPSTALQVASRIGPGPKAFGSIQRKVSWWTMWWLKGRLRKALQAAAARPLRGPAEQFARYVGSQVQRDVGRTNLENAWELLRLAWVLHGAAEHITSSLRGRREADAVQILDEYAPVVGDELGTPRQPWATGNHGIYVANLDAFGAVLRGGVEYLGGFEERPEAQKWAILTSTAGFNSTKGVAQLSNDLWAESWRRDLPEMAGETHVTVRELIRGGWVREEDWMPVKLEDVQEGRAVSKREGEWWQVVSLDGLGGAHLRRVSEAEEKREEGGLGEG